MEHLRGRAGDAHLNVVLRAELEESLKPRRRMFGPLPLVAVRQQHRETAEATPFVLTAGYKLINHYLRTVGEVTKLCLPHHETSGRCGRVPILKGQHGLL